MGSEGPWLLAFPYRLDIPIYQLPLISKWIFGQGGGEYCKRLKTCRKNNINHHSTSFPLWFQGKINLYFM
jgi:hypothetical protein